MIAEAADKVKHTPENSADRYSSGTYDLPYYEFYIKLAGYWKTTTIWCEESPRKSPRK